MDGITFDQWAPLDFKDPSLVSDVPGYLTDDQARRIIAYRMLSAYVNQLARLLLPDTADYDADSLREFGDLAPIVRRIASAVLGEDPTVVVPGADIQPADTPDIPRPPTNPDEQEGGDAGDVPPEVAAINQQVYAVAIERWQREAERALAEWQEQIESLDGLREQQTWLREWAKNERLIHRLRELESESVVPLGDGCVVVSWDGEKQRPTIEIMEPDAYMPVLDDANPSEFPTKVHLVWQYKDPEDDEVTLVRRITYELVPIDDERLQPIPPPAYLDDPAAQFRYACIESDGVWELDAIGGDIFNPEGEPTRGWSERKDPANPDGELLEVRDLANGLDFIPVVHVPNTLASAHHFGRSSIIDVLQLVDEINASDTDTSLAARWAAQPPAVVSGLSGATIGVTPGEWIRADKLDLIDMARHLATLLERDEDLQKRLSTNMGMPDGLRGRVDASEIPSGIALVLSFTPFVQLIASQLRPSREAKYPLLLKMVMRIAVQYAEKSGFPGERVPDAELSFGAYMPNDTAAAIEIATKAVAGRVSSIDTAVRYAEENGYPVESAAAEVARILELDGEGALAITDAVGPQYAAERLGIEDYENPVAVDEGEIDPGPIPPFGTDA